MGGHGWGSPWPAGRGRGAGPGGASREGGSGLSCPLAFTSLSPAHAKGTQISREHGSPDGRVNFSDNSQRWMWGHMEESGLPAWTGAAGPFLTRGTRSGLSHPLPSQLPWI